MKRRPAFSLMELILAIGLAIALVALLGMAINLHLVRLESGRTTIEQAQLARAVLDQIASDLIAVTTAPEQDVSEVMAAAESAAQFNVDEVDQAGGSSGASESSESEETAAEETEFPPGIYGTAESLTVDRRLMRQALTLSEPGVAPVTRADAAWARVAWGMSLNQAAPGLVRTETTHEHATWLNEQGMQAPVADPIAPEVRAVRFMYHDGQEYLPQWDMTEGLGLPIGVEVTIEVNPAEEADARASLELKQPRTYRRFVRLPAATEEPLGESGSATVSDTEGL